MANGTNGLYEGGVEYKLTFPPFDALQRDQPDEIEATPSSSLSFTSSANERAPVVVLLGWAGSTPRHLSKYSSFYENHGCITLQSITTSNVFFISFNENQLQKKSNTLLDVLLENNLEHHPLFFHIFSNGGCYTYNCMSNQMRIVLKYRKFKVEGCIYDSAPGRRRLINGMKALMSTMRNRSILKYFVAALFVIFVGFMQLMRKSKAMESKSLFMFECLACDPSQCPQLFLYSTTDDMILYQDVEDFMNERSQRGVHVSKMRWHDSAHVAHFLKHKDEYIDKCLGFIDISSKGTTSNL